MKINLNSMQHTIKMVADINDDMLTVLCDCGFNNIVEGFTVNNLLLSCSFFCYKCQKEINVVNNILQIKGTVEEPKPKMKFEFV